VPAIDPAAAANQEVSAAGVSKASCGS
jgi:hypothetical protein